uniref:Uncharacterized protein n=1 Tax=Cacopsylla melanoneura TaxID=428564 RepID=A0A8D8TAA9_9HEMI
MKWPRVQRSPGRESSPMLRSASFINTLSRETLPTCRVPPSDGWRSPRCPPSTRRFCARFWRRWKTCGHMKRCPERKKTGSQTHSTYSSTTHFNLSRNIVASSLHTIDLPCNDWNNYSGHSACCPQ